MTKYIADNPADQPFHDMMDEIEIAYQRAEKAGLHPLKIKWCLQYMVEIYEDSHPEIKEIEKGEAFQSLPKILGLLYEKFKK